MVVERDDVNLQASGANAGSLHVQLLAFDFALGAPPTNRAADTLPLGPASVALWQEIQRDTGQDLEMKVCGGLMLAENERDIEFLKGKIALEKSRGIEAELIGANELRALEPCIGDVAIAAEWCPGEGKINPLKGTYAVVAKAKALGARFRRGSNVTGASSATARTGRSQPAAARSAPGASSTRQGRGPPRSRAWSASRSGARRAAADGRHRAHGADAVAPGRLRPSPSHPEADGARAPSLIGGGWTAGLDEQNRLSRALRPSVEGNLWIASRAVPALRRPPRHPHLGRHERQHRPRPDPGRGVPGLPGFYNCVSSNGYTLAPVLSRLTAEMLAGRSTSLPVEAYSIRRFG